MLPLQTLKVLDLTRFLSGPFCTMILGDMGADVIKIERFPNGDETRVQGPWVNGESYCFAMVNRNKRSVGLDVTTARGRELLLELAASADVVVENFRPGVTQRLRIDYEAVRARKADTIYCSITGFGQDGPYRNRPGFDIIAQGLVGFLRMTGTPGDGPAKFGIAINDVVAGGTAVQAILAAYIHRLTSGEGQYIDLSLVESGLALTVWEAAAYFGSGETPEPNGTRHRRNAPYQAFRTSDGYVTIGGNTEPMWRLLCTQVLDAPTLVDDTRYVDKHRRLEHVAELEADIERITTTRTTDEWVARLDAAGLPGGPVLTYDQTLANEHIVARGMVQQMEHPVMGTISTLSPPAKFSATPLQLRLPAPAVGEHTAAVLSELGLSATQVDELIADGTVFDAGRAERVSPGAAT